MRRLARSLTDEDLSGLRKLLETRCDVHGIPRDDHLPARGPLAAGDHITGVHTDSEPDFGPVGIGHSAANAGERLANAERRADRTLGVVLVHVRNPEHGQDGVADELLGDPSVVLDLGVDELEELTLNGPHVLGIEPFAEGSRPCEIGEEHGDDAPLFLVGADGARRAPAWSGVPHVEQNATDARCSDPHAGHVCQSDAPHA